MHRKILDHIKAFSAWLKHANNHLALAFAVLGIAVSATALVVAWQANLISKQVARKSTDPYLIYENVVVPSEKPDAHELEIRVHNVGLGPALVLGFEAYKDARLVSGTAPVNGHDLAASYGFGDQATSRDELKYGQVIAPNERITIFKVTLWRRPMSWQEFSTLTARGEMAHRLITCYRSIYSDRYFAALNPQLPIPASSCASPGNYRRWPPLPDPSRIELDPPDL